MRSLLARAAATPGSRAGLTLDVRLPASLQTLRAEPPAAREAGEGCRAAGAGPDALPPGLAVPCFRRALCP